MSNGEIKLFTDGEVATTKDRKFTRVLGGFNNKEVSLTDIQLSILLNYKHGARQVREQVNNNISHFEFGLDIVDLKRDGDIVTLSESLTSLGYAKQAITQANNIYLFSKSGFLLFLKEMK